MNKDELVKFAHSLSPICNHFGLRRDRIRNWICGCHKNKSIMGVCLALPNVQIIHGENFEWKAYKVSFKTKRNAITISKKIAEIGNEKEIREILLHEIEHSKMSMAVNINLLPQPTNYYRVFR